MTKVTDDLQAEANRMATMFNEAIDKPSVFAKLFFDMEVFDYNRRYVDSPERFIVYRAGSKVGKTTSTAVKCLHAAFFADLVHPMVTNKCEIIIVAPTQSQANIMLSTIKGLLSSSKLLQPYIIRDTAFQIDVAFLSGRGFTSIYTRAAGERGDSLRGYIPHYIVFDEAAFIKRPIFDAMLPRGVATKAKIWMISTPFGKSGVFYETCMNSRSVQPEKYPHANPDGQFVEIRAKTSDNPFVKDDPSYLALLKTYTRDQYIQEVEGEFLDEGDNLFPLDMIQQMFRDYNRPEGVRYFLGVDVARQGGDDTVYTVLYTDPDRNHVYIDYIEVEKEKGDLVKVSKRIKQLCEAYPIEVAFVDGTGLGAGVVDMCRHMELPVREVIFSSKEKEVVFKNLRLIFENKRVHCQMTETTKRLAYQLSYLRKTYTANNIMRVESEEHDDYAYSLACGCEAVATGDAFGLLPSLPF